MERDAFKTYKIFKVIQLILLIIYSIAFFCFLYFDTSLRNNIYSNKNLMTICAFLWVFIIYCFVSLITDLYQLEKNIIINHTLSQTAYIDPLTSIPNHNSLDYFFDNTDNYNLSQIGCALITITNLSDINDKLGREKGDKCLREFSSIFETTGDRYGFVSRNGGNEFIVVIENCSAEKMQSFVDALSEEIKKHNVGNFENDIKISFQYVLNSEENLQSFGDLISRLYKGGKRGA